MRLWNKKLEPEKTLIGLLKLEEKDRLIGLVGGGGKTTAILRLAREYLAEGKRVVITTTTHMAKSKGIPLVLNGTSASLNRVLAQGGIVMTGHPDPKSDRKISGVTKEELEQYLELADVVLVEADGAKCLPFKAPAEKEPVLTERCDVVIGVAGLSAVGHTFREKCFRTEQAAALLGKRPDDLIEPVDLCRILTDIRGTRKKVRNSYRILLNQADTEEQLQMAGMMAEQLTAQGEIVGIAALKETVAAILLAAGNSTRFGGNKLLCEVQGKPMVSYGLELASALPFEQRILVTQYPAVAELGAQYRMQIIRNPHPERGIASSIRLGVEAASADHYLFLVCDQPWLKKTTVEALVERHLINPGGLTAIAFDGHRGNPNLFSAMYREELLGLEGDRGGKQILNKYPERVMVLEISNDTELEDIDYGN